MSKKDLPWYCKDNMDAIAVLLDRTNHQGEDLEEIKAETIETKQKIIKVDEKIDLLTEKVEGPLLSRREIAMLISAIIAIAEFIRIIGPILFG
jgi:uncharacterized coiled-coil protein SlyX